ncbi:Aldose 1-epimerase [Leclercia adecarboxylata]|uniref:Aldose 1-epimerase n=1 Tax=Leclercia adecarboxylata TaxID=83655 RepID=A0A4U9HMS4_9ENTR|nr:Aldose 1-epimerase [Leclercia adecarboxylata]
MDWGATLLSARVPMSDGSVRETLLGCASPEQYVEQTAFLGASVGRYANRIAKSRFELDGVPYALLPSQGEKPAARRPGRLLISVAGASSNRTMAKRCCPSTRRMAIRAIRVIVRRPCITA